MGGENTEISESTVNIFLEAANFNPQNNRRTAGLLGMRSEATLRFEKGLRAGLAEVAIKRCLKIIQEVAGGEIAPGLIDEWPGKGIEQTHVDLTRNQISRVMGVEYPVEQVEATFASLGLDFEPLGADRTTKAGESPSHTGVPTSPYQKTSSKNWRASLDMTIYRLRPSPDVSRNGNREQSTFSAIGSLML